MVAQLVADLVRAGPHVEDVRLGAPRHERIDRQRGAPRQRDEQELDRDFDRWAVLDGYHKVYAACQYTHSALEASLELAHGALAGSGTETIEEIVVQTHPLAYGLDNTAPTTTLAGKFSLPHVVGAVLASGRTDPTVFDESLLHDETVARLRRVVRLEAFEPLPDTPHDRPARVIVRRADGSSHEVVVLSAVGGPDRPLDEEQVLGKIADLTTGTPTFAPLARRLVTGRELDDEPWGAVLGQAWQR